MREESLEELARDVIDCKRCPRLRTWCEDVAKTRVARFRNETYWGRPLPGFGDPRARLLVVGLAPAAHGGNRTGRVFTGDRSGDFLFASLHRAGFASSPRSVALDDGLMLRDCYIAPIVRCAPPANRPTPVEIRACRPYLAREFAILSNLRAILALGQMAFSGFLAFYREAHKDTPKGPYLFGHGRTYDIGALRLFASYHPSQQNTFTGKLTARAFDRVLRQIGRFLEEGSS